MNNKHFHRPKTLELELLITGLVLVSGHILGAFWNWYDKFAFFDILVHFTGGVWVTLVLFAAFPLLRAANKTKQTLLVAALFSFMVGGLWELFEFTVENYYLINFQGPPPDTFLDLIIDTLGGLGTALYLKLRD